MSEARWDIRFNGGVFKVYGFPQSKTLLAVKCCQVGNRVYVVDDKNRLRLSTVSGKKYFHCPAQSALTMDILNVAASLGLVDLDPVAELQRQRDEWEHSRVKAEQAYDVLGHMDKLGIDLTPEQKAVLELLEAAGRAAPV